ncbi:uncharacterized protein PV06_00086 [Exophiala oligosperma]|uniref:Pumilio homology domain family member 3 n=1 Tax=Exophiala oligosperma TaxID=215243 RepID=A0A0D2B555_9EURO|nr:uncharacterized protein PV06_00086 [Exophiala oligosperma]KIW47386.1 hypothetical protein PV06_00086 [Exophiala oligosperma]
MESGPSLETSRNGRVPNTDRTSSPRPPTAMRTDFDRGKSAWGVSSRIWGTGTSLYDDEQATSPFPAQQGSSSGFGSSRTASASMGTELNNEEPVQSRLPWNSTSTGSGYRSRQRTQPLSPTGERRHQGFNFMAGEHDGHVEGSSLFEGSAPDVEDDPLPGRRPSDSRRAVTESSRFMQSPTRTTSFSRSPFATQLQNTNVASYNNNAIFASLDNHDHHHLNRSPIGSSASPVSALPFVIPTCFATSRPSEQLTMASSRYGNISPRLGGTARTFPNGQAEHPYTATAREIQEALQSFQALNLSRVQNVMDGPPGRRPSAGVPRHQSDGRPTTVHAALQAFGGLSDVDRQLAIAAGNGFVGSRLNPQAVPHYGGLPYAGRGTLSPMATEYRSNSHSPHSSQVGTPPTGPLSVRSTPASGVSSRSSGYDSSSTERNLPGADQYSCDERMFPPGSLQQQLSNGFHYDSHGSMQHMRLTSVTNSYMLPGHPVMHPFSQTSRIPTRDLEQNPIARSAVLDDFRLNSKTNKRFELKDIYTYVVEFSGDQHGSRFIQQKLETANSDEKEQIFKEIQPNLLQLMTDVFGNYVIQKMFEHGNQSQKKVLANQMRGHVMHLSLQMYGCRVVQKAFEHVLTDQQATLVKELDGPNQQVLKVVRDQNGNHVIQKAIERIPGEHIQFIVDAFKGQTAKMSTHQYGCRVVQRMLEHCAPQAKRVILDELLEHIIPLISDNYGNYVVQHIIQNGEPQDRRFAIDIVLRSVLMFSKHKFASNIVEKSIEFADEDQRQQILRTLTTPDEYGTTPVLQLMRDQYGNYVLQKVYDRLQGEALAALVADMKKNLPELRRTSYGKQVAAIEKLLYPDQDSSNASTSSRNSVQTTASNSTSAEGDRAKTHQGQAR